MIDLEKERELFKSAMISSEIHQEEEFEIDEYGNFSWIGTDESFDVWRERAKLAKAEQEKLEAEFNANLAKVEQGIDAMAQGFLAEIESLKAQLAQYQSDDYVLVPKSPTNTMIDAVRNEHEGESYLPYSLYFAFIKQAMIEAQEKDNAKP